MLPASSSLLKYAAWAGMQLKASTSLRAFAATAVPAGSAREGLGVVPPGHKDSDLSPTVCHIGLGRRRDLTLRQDLSLVVNGKTTPLSDIFQGKKVIVVGFPGGKVCTEKHIPGYVQMTDALERKGVDQVLCVSPASPESVQELAAKPGLTSPKVQLASDPGCGFIRLLGLELGIGKDTGPRCQRFAGIVENGILLKVKVEDQPADLKQTDAQSMCALWEDVYGHLGKK